MWRKVFGIVGGYAVMVVFIAATFNITYFAMGTERSYRPGSYEVSGAWLGAMFVLGFLAAVLGGWICVLIARNSQTPKVFAAIVLVLGLLFAIPVLLAEPPTEVRPAEVSAMEAMRKSHQPEWVALLNPFLGAIGVTLGSRLKKV